MPIKTPWSSSFVLNNNKYGDSRFFEDFRKLNAGIKRDRWPMPRDDEIFEEVQDSSVLTYSRGISKSR